MVFKKGGEPWNKGTKGKVVHSEQWRKDHSKKMKGNKFGWMGGKHKDSRGYVWIYCPDHPYAVNTYVREHRLIMEKHIGRVLLPTEVVHHIDGNLENNEIQNLMLFTSQAKHNELHRGKGGRFGR